MFSILGAYMHRWKEWQEQDDIFKGLLRQTDYKDDDGRRSFPTFPKVLRSNQESKLQRNSFEKYELKRESPELEKTSGLGMGSESRWELKRRHSILCGPISTLFLRDDFWICCMHWLKLSFIHWSLIFLEGNFAWHLSVVKPRSNFPSQPRVVWQY